MIKECPNIMHFHGVTANVLITHHHNISKVSGKIYCIILLLCNVIPNKVSKNGGSCNIIYHPVCSPYKGGIIMLYAYEFRPKNNKIRKMATVDENLHSLNMECCVHRNHSYHIYSRIWNSLLGEVLTALVRETMNTIDML